jgi:hypothetical protein
MGSEIPTLVDASGIVYLVPFHTIVQLNYFFFFKTSPIAAHIF